TIAVDPSNGRIVIGGGSGTTERVTLVRLNANGTADQGFANAGIMVTDSVVHSQGSRANAIVINPNSSILVAGYKGASSSTGFAILERYDSAGVRDSVGTYASGCRGAALAIATNGDAVIVGDDQTAPVACITRFEGSGNGNFSWS